MKDCKQFACKLAVGVMGLGILIGLYFIQNIVFILLTSLFLVLLFSPFLNTLNKYGIRDLIGMIIILLIFLGLFGLIIVSIYPIIIEDGKKFLESSISTLDRLIETYNSGGINSLPLPSYIKDILTNVNLESLLNSSKDNFASISSRISDSGISLINGFGIGIFNIVMTIIFVFFIAVERYQIKSFIYKVLPNNISGFFKKSEGKIMNDLSKWFKGQLILSVLMFFITLIGLSVLKLFGIEVKGIFTLALIAGLMEFLPYIGAILSFGLALLLGAGNGINGFIAISILYFVIQQIEGNFLVPYIMSKTLSLSAFGILLSMTIAGSLFGIVGLIFSVPVYTILQIFYNRIYK